MQPEPSPSLIDRTGRGETTFARRRQLAFLAGCLAMLVFAISAAILPAALLRAAADLRVPAATLTLTIATQFGAFVLATLLGGMLSDRLGKHVLLQAACLLTIAGALLWAGARGLPQAHLAAALLGMGGGILESLGSALLADLYPERRKLVLNLTQVAYCLGAAAGPACMALLLPHEVSWRLFFVAEALLGGALLLLYNRSPAPPPSREAAAGIAELLHPLRDRSVLLLALGLFGYVLAESGVAVAVNIYLRTQHGAPESWAILGLTVFWGAMLLGRLICATLPERLPTERLLAGLALAGALALAAQPLARQWHEGLLLVGVCGFLFSGIWPLMVVLTASRHAARSGGAVGVVVAGGALGVVAAPLLVAALLNGAQAWLFPALAPGLLLTAIVVLLPVRSAR